MKASTIMGLILGFSAASIQAANVQLFLSPNQASESCRFNSTMPHSTTRPRDLKTEKILCQVDWHSSLPQYKKKGQLYATTLCPKLVSTSPALELYMVPQEMSVEEFKRDHCVKKDRPGKKLAKYKLSTSCSYTPSILSYYHLGRFLGIGEVPVAVLRTFDREVHISLAKEAVELTSSQEGWLAENWKILYQQLTSSHRQGEKNPVLHPDGDKSYGAVVENPTRERIYSEFFGSGTSGYLKVPLFKSAKKRGGIERQFPKNFNNLPMLFALKDFTDMLVIDAILGQFDRYGNVHSLSYFYFLEEGQLKRKRAKENDLEQIAQMQAKGAVKVRRLLLKDNDCGIKFRNRTIDDKALEKIRHLSKETFNRLNQLKEKFQTAEFKSWLTNELLFTDEDIQLIYKNLAYITHLFNERIESGKLLLDLNPSDFI